MTAFSRMAQMASRRRFGQDLGPIDAMAANNKVLMGYGFFESFLERANKMDESLKHLAVMKTAAMVGCEWCIDFGSMLHRLDGLDVERLKHIDDYATSPAYSDDERAAIAYANAMTTDPHAVTDEQVADLRTRFGDAGVLELSYQIGVENMRARMYSALGITEQGFSSGDACRVPWMT